MKCEHTTTPQCCILRLVLSLSLHKVVGATCDEDGEANEKLVSRYTQLADFFDCVSKEPPAQESLADLMDADLKDTSQTRR